MENLAGLILLSLRLGLAIILFLFLYWAVRIIWKDFAKTAWGDESDTIPTISLGLEAEDTNIRTFATPEITLGRATTCDLQIPDETVSSLHAKLFYSHHQWWVEDCGSSNGSFLNEVLVSTATVLTQGDQLRLGKIRIYIEFPQ